MDTFYFGSTLEKEERNWKRGVSNSEKNNALTI